jgi:hypothetical protein
MIWAAVPKTSVHKDQEARASEYDVWLTFKRRPHSKPEASLKKGTAEHEFGFRVTRPNARHAAAALGGGHGVGQFRLPIVLDSKSKAGYPPPPRGAPSQEQGSLHLLLSLFCGAGGLDLGFENADFEIGLAFDKKADSVRSYNHNRTDKHGHCVDVNDLTLEKLDALWGSQFAPETSLIQAGYIKDTSITLPRDFESICKTESGTLRELRRRAPFHVVNIDACGSIVRLLLPPIFSTTKRNRERDVEVSSTLRAEGWRVLRYWDHDVRNDLDRVVKEIEGLWRTGRDCSHH